MLVLALRTLTELVSLQIGAGLTDVGRAASLRMTAVMSSTEPRSMNEADFLAFERNEGCDFATGNFRVDYGHAGAVQLVITTNL